MDTQQLVNQVNKLNQLLAEAGLLASELEGVLMRRLDAEAEAIESQGKALEDVHDHYCAGDDECHTCGKTLL